jgi:hypothetical protein
MDPSIRSLQAKRERRNPEMTSSTRRARVFLLGIALALTSLLSACVDGTTTGGGWIESFEGGGNRATFAFTARCVKDKKSGDLVPKAQFEFQDRAANVALHGTVTSFVGENGPSCDPEGEDSTTADMTGTYRPQPKKLSSNVGLFELSVTDGGEPGPSNEDHVCLDLESGAYPGYSNCGDVQGGNIQVFPRT